MFFYYLLAMVLTRQGREVEAVAHYRRSAELAPEQASFRFDLMVSLCTLGRGNDAAGLLPRAQRDFPDDPRFVELPASCRVDGS